MSGSGGWDISQSPSDDETEAKPMCQYGAKCYRKNPAHLAEFSHPKRTDVDEEHKVPDHASKVNIKEDTKRKDSGRLDTTTVPKRVEELGGRAKRTRYEEDSKETVKRKDSGRLDTSVPKRVEEVGGGGPKETVKRTDFGRLDTSASKRVEEVGGGGAKFTRYEDEPKETVKRKDSGRPDTIGAKRVEEEGGAVKWTRYEDDEPEPKEETGKRSRVETPKLSKKTSEIDEPPPPKMKETRKSDPEPPSKPRHAVDGPADLEKKEEKKPMCPHGIKCYRKNLVHFAEFDHPIKGTTTTVDPVARKEAEEDPKMTTKTPPAKKQKIAVDPDDVWPEEDDEGGGLPPGLTRSYSSMTEKERKQLIADAIKAKARMEEEMKKKEADLIELMKKKEADMLQLIQQKVEQEKKSEEVARLLMMKGEEADSLRRQGEEASLVLKKHQEEAQRILKAKQEAEEQLKQTKKAAQHLLKKKDEAVQKEKEKALLLLKEKEAEAEKKLAAVTAEAKKKWDDYKEQLKKDLVVAQESLRQGGSAPMLIKGEAEALAGGKTVFFPLYAQRTHDNSAEQVHFRLAESQFYRLLENNDYRVTMVEYVVSPSVVARYKKAIGALTALRAKDMTPEAVRKLKEGQPHTEARCVLDPVLGFHGTATKNIASICELGFKVPGAADGFTHSTDAGWYGRGVYFSEFPSYAMEYITSGTKLLLCQVVLGKIYHCTKLIHGAALQTGYDSHMSPDGKEVVIFNSEHILPSYVVHYTKKTGLFEYSRPLPTADDSLEEAPWQKSKDAAEALEFAKKRLAAKGDEESKVFKGVVFVTCGKLLLSVKAMNEMLEEFAGSVATNVSSEVSFVLSTQDEVNKKGPKIAQAMTKKVPILDQSFAFDCIRNGRYDYKTHKDYLLPVPS